MTNVLKKDDIRGVSLEGVTPESWLCVDCSYNTAPGMLPRVQMEMVFALGNESITMTFTEDSEVYMVREAIWRRAGMEGMGGCLCVGCLEKRIGRRLKPKDFERDHPLNMPYPCTPRLKSRRER